MYSGPVLIILMSRHNIEFYPVKEIFKMDDKYAWYMSNLHDDC